MLPCITAFCAAMPSVSVTGMRAPRPPMHRFRPQPPRVRSGLAGAPPLRAPSLPLPYIESLVLVPLACQRKSLLDFIIPGATLVKNRVENSAEIIGSIDPRAGPARPGKKKYSCPMPNAQKKKKENGIPAVGRLAGRPAVGRPPGGPPY